MPIFSFGSACFLSVHTLSVVCTGRERERERERERASASLCVCPLLCFQTDFLFVSWKEHFNYKYFERRRLTVSVFEFTEIDLREVEVELLYCPQKGS
jgi:hypothetical protein